MDEITCGAVDARATGLNGPRTRRGFLRDAGVAVANMTAAHELAERGFAVTLYERRAWGGKARSTEVPGSAAGGRRPLPGEHGFRVEFGFYQNLPDTLRRIPFGANADGVFGNLVEMPQFGLARTAKPDLVAPLGSLDPRPYTPAQILDLVTGLLLETNLPPEAVAQFADRIIVFLSSCHERRFGQWEQTSWIDFIGADRYSQDYRNILGGAPQIIEASKPEQTSARFPAWVLEVVIYSLLGFGANGPTFRVLNGPTNEAWINPWLAVLDRLGVQRRIHHELSALEIRNGRIVALRVRIPRGQQTVTADWYVYAIPVERARSLWSPAILAADPALASMQHLNPAWMNGIQFYLRDQVPIISGILDCADSPWSASFIPQAQFWAVDFASTYGDGRHSRQAVGNHRRLDPARNHVRQTSERMHAGRTSNRTLTWEVGNTGAANYNGRRAANAVLRGTGSNQTPSTTVDPYRPPEWEPFKRIDQDRYTQGQPNLFDIDRRPTTRSKASANADRALNPRQKPVRR